MMLLADRIRPERVSEAAIFARLRFGNAALVQYGCGKLETLFSRKGLRFKNMSTIIGDGRHDDLGIVIDNKRDSEPHVLGPPTAPHRRRFVVVASPGRFSSTTSVVA